MKRTSSTLKFAGTCAAIGWLCWSTGNVSLAQNAPATLSPDLVEVVKLSQAHMPDDVIKNYISSSGKSYRLSADDIIYLNNQGVSPAIIGALQTSTPAYSAQPGSVPTPVPASPMPAPNPVVPTTPAPQPTAAPQGYAPMPQPANVSAPMVDNTPPPPPEVNFQYFHDQLAPYGSWINIGGVMYWHPDQAMAVNPDWRPYYDMGQWVQTDNGLYWQSDYTWGDIPFHYGRWVLNPTFGWVWAPDYVWGPAWVFWRQDSVDAAIGWAPLPVGAVFVNGGFMFNGVAVGVDFDFGLGEGCFTFVGYDHFHEGFFRMRGHEWAYHIDHARVHGFYGRSVLHNEFSRDEHGRFVNNSIGRDRVEHLTHVEHSSFEERNPVGDRNRLASQHFEDARKQPFNNNAVNHDYTANHDNTFNRGAVNAGNEHGAPNAFDRQNDHAQSFNAGAQHGQTFGADHGGAGGSASKVYRPPTSSMPQKNNK